MNYQGDIMRILFCQLRSHGDIIRTFPVIDAIRDAHPDWFLGYTCYEEMAETCKLNVNIDEIYIQPKFKPVTKTDGGTRILDCSYFTNIVNKVKHDQFDVYVDFHGVFQSALFGAICDIRKRIGRSKETAKDGAELFYNEILQVSNIENNKMERHLRLVKMLLPEINIAKKECDLKNESCSVISIFPGSSKIGILKRWGVESYKELANNLSNKNKVEIIITPEDIDLKNELYNQKKYEVKIIDNWRDVLKQIERSMLVVGNDGVFTHMSIWKKIPTIMILGPTSATVNGIWKYGTGENIIPSLSCKCPHVWNGICNNNHRCMKSIKVEDVISAVNKYIGK